MIVFDIQRPPEGFDYYCADIISDEASYITGGAFPIDGEYLLPDYIPNKEGASNTI